MLIDVDTLPAGVPAEAAVLVTDPAGVPAEAASTVVLEDAVWLCEPNAEPVKDELTLPVGVPAASEEIEVPTVIPVVELEDTAFLVVLFTPICVCIIPPDDVFPGKL